LAYEILDKDTVTPHRLHALVRLVARLEGPKRKGILDLLQPPELGLNQESASDVILAAKHCNLINEETDGALALNVPSSQSENLEDFRNLLRKLLLGITEEGYSNYNLNLFTAWYCVQDNKVFSQYESGFDYAAAFNSQILPNLNIPKFEQRKINAWREWAAFLGFGWILRSGSRNSRVILVPDAYGRLEAVLDELLERGPAVRFGEFIERLGQRCPELDGGSLFEYCWKVCNPGERRSNTVSLMLSNALYQLHAEGKIVLQRSGDALENWQLFPAAGQALGQVSHIYRGEN
jgi:hypothetical protein